MIANNLKIVVFCIFLIFCNLITITETFAADNHIFSTWNTFEVDKCASMWLIKRFIDPKAEFKFFPHGTTINEGIPFDTPDAKFRRYATKSTYETLLEHYRLKDSRLKYIGRVIHDIEINNWGRKVCKESSVVLHDIRGIISAYSGDYRAISEKSLEYFDQFYRNIALR